MKIYAFDVQFTYKPADSTWRRHTRKLVITTTADRACELIRALGLPDTEIHQIVNRASHDGTDVILDMTAIERMEAKP